MAMDLFKNFAYGTIVVPPTPPNLGTTLTVGSGHSSRFPAPPFSASVWPIGLPADPTNAEIIRVTGIAGDVWTIQRAQESSTARAILNTDQVAQALTTKAIADLKADCLAAAQSWVQAQNFATQAWANSTFATPAWVNGQGFAPQSWVSQFFVAVGPRVWNGPAAGAYTPNVDTTDVHCINAANQDFWMYPPLAPNTGVYPEGRVLIIRIRDNGAARTIYWQGGAGGYGSQNSAIALPTTTVPYRTLHLAFRYNALYGWWALLALTQE